MRLPKFSAARARGAAIRAGLVFVALTAPLLAAPGATVPQVQVTLVLAGLAAIFVLFEYGARTPAIVDFRFAPPLNRLRFALVCLILIAVTAFAASPRTGEPEGFRALGFDLAEAMEGPASPADFVAELLATSSALGPDPEIVGAAAIAFVFGWGGVVVFSLAIWFGGWPHETERFNPWVNLPTFEPAEGRDAAARLRNLGVLVITTAVALPLALPVLGSLLVAAFDVEILGQPMVVIALATLWAGAPGATMLRGIALLKVARMSERGELA